MSADHPIAEVEKVNKSTGEHPAARWQLTINAVEAMAKSLRYAEAERAMPIMNGGNFHHLVQFTGQNGDEDEAWYITERIMFPRSHMYYTIALPPRRDRLGLTPEPKVKDWLQHRAGDRASAVASIEEQHRRQVPERPHTRLSRP